jgi:methionyl-tRNA formyltransferase
MMKIIILTSAEFGTAAHHLPYIIESKACEVSMVILNKNTAVKKGKSFKRIFSKIKKIGPLGALNGIRIRKWFTDDMLRYKKINNLQQLCVANKIPFYTTDGINTQTTIELFKKADADIGISLGNGYIGEKVFTIPTYGMINIHHEILPDYQNAQSIIWQIYNMSANTGFTIHKIDKQIDTGHILFQQKVPIDFLNTLRETVAKTSVSLLEASAMGLVKLLGDFEELFKSARPQGNGTSYTTPSFSQFMRISKNFKKLKQLSFIKNPE